MSIQVGDRLPEGQLHEKTPDNTHTVSTLFAGKKAILFAVPGAFTPGCSNTHFPGYLEKADAFFAQGYDFIACVSVNDAFVMDAWGKHQQVGDRILMLADPLATFTRALGLDVNAAVLGGDRSKRYSMVIEDGVVTQLNVEPNGFGLTCSLASELK
jgi:2-Cys peroxiredoxin 5